jgi:beta-lactamase regulating signal transducer with metallopeptidase domain
MSKAQKILLVVGIVGVAIGGFVLAKYLTRNVRKYKFYTITVQKDDKPALSSEDVE